MDLATFFSLAGLTPVTVTVEAYDGGGGYGDRYAEPATVGGCWVEHRRRNMRAPDGSTTASTATVYAPAGTTCPPRSRVTLPDATATVAIATTTRSAGGLDLPAHVEINVE